jgi:hypothetical protein
MAASLITEPRRLSPQKYTNQRGPEADVAVFTLKDNLMKPTAGIIQTVFGLSSSESMSR